MEPEKEEQSSLLDRLMSNIGPNAPEDSPGYFRVPTFPAIRGKIPYKKPIQLPDYAGYEDLYTRWEQQKPNLFGTRPNLEQKVDDFEGHGPGRIIVKSKDNAGPEGIYFYPANIEFNKALAQDTRDIADIQFIGGTISSVLAAAKGGYRLRAHQKRQLETMRANEATYVGSNAPQLKGKLQKQIEPIVTGMVTKEDPVALGRQEFEIGTPGMYGDYAFQSTDDTIFEGRFQNVNELDRVTSGLVQNRKTTPRGSGFLKWYKAATEYLKKVYRSMSSGEINDHHSNILKSGISLHENRDENESLIIKGWFVEDSIYSGDDPLNNHSIPEQVHGLVHKWLNERIGRQYLTKLLGPPGSALRTRWENLPIDHPDVKSVVKQYAEYVNGATMRTAELMQAYYKIWGPNSQITTEQLDLIYDKLGISELEYDQLIKPGLSRKDAIAYRKQYGSRVKYTWADGYTESIYERLLREIDEDPKLGAQIDKLNEEAPKIGDFSNEPDSPTPAERRRSRWKDEIDELTDIKNKAKQGLARRLTKEERARLRELINLYYYGGENPLFRFRFNTKTEDMKQEGRPKYVPKSG